MKYKKWIRRFSLLVLTIILSASGYYFFPEKKLPENSKVDSLVVVKSERKMMAYSKGYLLKTYSISLGKNPLGKKQREGDNKTPEGRYFINERNPYSDYYKMLGVSYPNKKDLANAKKHGWPSGGAIKIHGIRNGFAAIGKFQRWVDWTAGCIALTNEDLEELYLSVKVGCPIVIKP